MAASNCGAFRRILRVAFNVFYVRLGYIWLDDCPAGLDPPAGARNMRKATVKIRRNTL